ncbi:MAG: hypothetical protein ACXVEI_07405 [Actinomycetota bacterium]
MLRKTKAIVAGAIVVSSMLALAPLTATSAAAAPRAAAAPSVAHHGSCSAQADWKLKVAPENGRLQVEFEVEHATAGDHWQVTIKENGSQLVSSTKVVQADRSFHVKHRAHDTSGADRFVARETNASSGESCVGKVTF